MKLNSKVTWGLAWAGLAVVLAVPSADYLTSQFGLKGRSAAVITSTTDPVTTGTSKAPVLERTAAVTTKVTKTGVKIIPAGSPKPTLTTNDPVDKFVNSGKSLPDYISDGDSGQTAKAAPVLGAPADEPTQVANLDTSATLAPPMPVPRRPPDLVRPTQSTPAEPRVIVDEGALPVDDGAVPFDESDGMPDRLAVTPDGPLPPAGIEDDWRGARDRRLTNYLEQNGLIDGGSADGRSSASVTVVERPSADYDPNGFYLSDGPNNSKAQRRARIERMLEDDGDVDWF
jgi:hypothetical protein